MKVTVCFKNGSKEFFQALKSEESKEYITFLLEDNTRRFIPWGSVWGISMSISYKEFRILYEENREFSDEFDCEIKSIFGCVFIRNATPKEDMKNATDYVFEIKGNSIVSKMRNFSYLSKYGNEFTLRSSTRCGINQSELEKILSGWGNYLFYGLCDKNKEKIIQWLIGDLDVFRQWYKEKLKNGRKPGFECTNKKDGGKFTSFRISDLLKEFIIARKLYND